MALTQISLTGTDTLQIFGRTITGFGNGDYFKFAFDEELIKMEIGKDGNAVIAQNAPGTKSKGVLKILRGCPDDVFLNAGLSAELGNFSRFALGNCVARKVIGTGNGNITNDVYILSGGVYSKFPGVTGNQQGDTEQAMAVYEFMFAAVTRTLG